MRKILLEENYSLVTLCSNGDLAKKLFPRIINISLKINYLMGQSDSTTGRATVLHAADGFNLQHYI